MFEILEKSHSFVAPPPEELAALLPAYDIEAFIAQGGMGAVYQARQRSLDRPVAIKILPRVFGSDPRFRESFAAEARAMARLNHSNLIGVHDFGEVDGMLYIVMELVHGKALYYSAHGKTIDPGIALRLTAQICRGLAHAHAEGILHRDIKPANILLDPDARPKVGDFGLASAVGQKEGDGMVYGTPGYTAPEVYSRSHPVDHRSDLFSVGVVLYELLSGIIPEAGSVKLETGIDPELDDIIRRTTDPDPEVRPASAEELAKELERLRPAFESHSTLEPGTAPFPPARSTTRTVVIPAESSTAALWGVAALVAVLAILLVYAINSRPEKAPETLTVTASPEEILPADPPPRDPQPKPDPNPNPETAPMPEDPVAVVPIPEPTPPTPEPEPEKPLEALARLKKALLAGKRDEFPPGTVQRNGSAYFFFTNPVNWTQATAIAAAAGGQLATLPTPADLDWAVSAFNLEAPVWLGACDSGTEGKWTWPEGDTLDPELWAAGQPDDAVSGADGEDFAILDPATKGLGDELKIQRHGFFIEWKMDGTNPGSLESQLARTAAALAAGQSPVFPCGTENINGSRFLLVSREMNWVDAEDLARKGGGHLAVASNPAEATWQMQLMEDLLRKEEACWIGARRDELDPGLWTTVTGEKFAFPAWLAGEPEPTGLFLAFRRRGAVVGWCAEPPPGGVGMSHLLLEWSHPSLRNMPDPDASPADKSETILDEIRLKVREVHSPPFEKVWRSRARIVERFYRFTEREVEGDRDLDPVWKIAFLAFITQSAATGELPAVLPAGTPEKIAAAHLAAVAEITAEEAGALPVIAAAKAACLTALEAASATATAVGDLTVAATLEAEKVGMETDPARIITILKNEIPPAP